MRFRGYDEPATNSTVN